jgi:flagellar assembly factor FliW
MEAVPCLETAELGRVEYSSGEVIEFPAGLPAFEDVRRFILVNLPGGGPLVVLQCVDRPNLRFLCLPWSDFVGGAAPELGDAERACLGLESDGGAGELVALATVIAPSQGPAAVNLLAPILIEPRKRRGVQAIQPGAALSAQHPLAAEPEGEAQCS